MKFYLTDEIVRYFKDIRHFGINYELEARIILENDFTELEEGLIKSGIQKESSLSTVEIIPKIIMTNNEPLKNVRKIYSNNKISYEKKNNLKNFDVEYKDFSFRLSLSTENDVPNDNILNEDLPTLTRKRDRREYREKNDNYKYVFTTVTSIGKDRKEYITQEFEIEYNLTKPLEKLLENIKNSVENISWFLTNNLNNISYIPKSLLDYANKTFYSLNIQEIKPVNLKRYHVKSLLDEEFSVTNKLDGERFFLLFCNYGLFAINKTKVELLSNTTSYNPPTVLDSEFFKGIFYVFDCLLYEGLALQDMTHADRINDISIGICETITDEGEVVLKTKEFFTDLKNCTKTLLNTLVKKDNDGLIYTSKFGNIVYKWKFPEKMSIDFKVKKIESFVYELYVTGQNKNFLRFQGNKKYPLKLKDSIYISDFELINNAIYEFSYNRGKFVMDRQRRDKIYPNFYKVAEDVWYDIADPFTESELLALLNGETFNSIVEYRKSHNIIKRNLIEEYCQDKIVLDLGAGRGGDLGKYEDNHVKYLIAIEPNTDNLKELLNRLDTSFTSMISKIRIGQAEAQNTKYIKEILKNSFQDEVDVIASFFSLSFFFFNEKDLDDLVNTIDKCLKNGGVFIGTTIDGIKTLELLEKNNGKFQFEGGMYELLSNGVVKLTQKETIVGEQLESLVDFTLLQRKLELKDIYLEDSKFFQKNQNLSDTENQVSTMYRTFVFKKDISVSKGSCDDESLNLLSTYKKIIGAPSIDLEQLKKYSKNFISSDNKKINLVHKTVIEI